MKINNRVLLFFILGYLFLVILTNTYLFFKIKDITSERDITSKVSAEIRFCVNRPPVLNYTCNLSVYQDQRFYCKVNVTDHTGNSISYDISFISSPATFNLSTEGIIDFTPNASQVGIYYFTISVWDDSDCANNLDYKMYNLTVINVNDPPVLIAPIPNQTWVQDTSITPFDLDEFFYDPDGDVIIYTKAPELSDNMIIEINNENIVTFIPNAGWFGTETLLFFAWDPYYANSSSNNITLLVTEKNIPPVNPEGGSSGGGGGGGGGSPPSCLPRWYCRPFGKCEPDYLKRRECFDLNNCSTTIGKPNLTESCEFISTCYDGFKGKNEENVDCGGPCPPCGSCYDNLCNNNEDCILGLSSVPDCGGPCAPCSYGKNGTCYDNICNNKEDCTKDLTDIPDCGGPCYSCPLIERPVLVKIFNWGLLIFLLMSLLVSAYLVKKTYPSLVLVAKKKKRKDYEQRLLLETKISESIFDSLLKLENILSKEDIDKLILLFATIVRKYFKSLFDLRYEFTYEELMKEIQSRNISPTFKSILKTFFVRSTEMEFSGKSVSKLELQAMISEFKQIVSFTNEEPLLDEEKMKKTKEGTLNKVDKMFVKISEAESSLRRLDLNSAYFKYLRLVQDFKFLPEEERRKLHDFIARLYDEIKLAREEYEKNNQNFTKK